MPDGRRFPNAGQIDSGWVLQVPLPSTAVEEINSQVFYPVERGDTLGGIAARLLSDESRWQEFFALNLNDGVARLDGSHVLHQENLIWPGLRLPLPLTVAPAAPPPPSPPPAASPGRRRGGGGPPACSAQQ